MLVNKTIWEELEMPDKNVIIFGCGGVGCSIKDYLEESGDNVIAFADNNPEKWGTCLEDILIIKPSDISAMQYDFVAIGNFRQGKAIKKQLSEMGVPSEKIVFPIEQRKIYVNPTDYTKEELVSLAKDNYDSKAMEEYLNWNITIDDSDFMERLERVKEALFRYHIPREKVCIVKGNVLAAHGIRKFKISEDTDIIMTSDLRDMYGRGKVYIDENIEMVPIYCMHGRDDDDIIRNPERHIVFEGLKFMRLNDLYEYKKEIRLIRSNRKGLREEIALMKDFYLSRGMNPNHEENQFMKYVGLPE